MVCFLQKLSFVLVYEVCILFPEFKEGHLYDKFLTSLKSLLGTKPTSSGEESEQRGTTHTMFSPDIERQMREKGIYDSFLQINFESLMTGKEESHTLLEDKFVR